MSSGVLAPTPHGGRAENNAYVERRQDDLRTAITNYVVDQTRELHEAINMLQSQVADLSAQMEETSALVLRLEERTRRP